MDTDRQSKEGGGSWAVLPRGNARRLSDPTRTGQPFSKVRSLIHVHHNYGSWQICGRSRALPTDGQKRGTGKVREANRHTDKHRKKEGGRGRGREATGQTNKQTGQERGGGGGVAGRFVPDEIQEG